MFWLDRIDIIIIDKLIFNWCRTQLPELDTRSEVTVHSLFSGSSDYPVLFSSSRLRDQFDVGLKRLRHSGQYENIINKYQLPSAKILSHK